MTRIGTTVPELVSDDATERGAARENKDDDVYVLVGCMGRYVAMPSAMILTTQSTSVT